MQRIGIYKKAKGQYKRQIRTRISNYQKVNTRQLQHQPISNILNHDKSMIDIFVWQPFGTQDYPDFMIFTQKYIIPVEIKYSSDTATSPMWNGNLPKANGIYVFGNNKKQDIVLFKGIDILSNKTIKHYQHEIIKQKEIKNNNYNFKVSNIPFY